MIQRGQDERVSKDMTRFVQTLGCNRMRLKGVCVGGGGINYLVQIVCMCVFTFPYWTWASLVDEDRTCCCHLTPPPREEEEEDKEEEERFNI